MCIYIYICLNKTLKIKKTIVGLFYSPSGCFFPSKNHCNTKQTRTNDLSQTPTNCSHYNKSSQLDPQESWKICEFKSLSSNPSPPQQKKKHQIRYLVYMCKAWKVFKKYLKPIITRKKRLGSAERWGGQAWFTENNSLPIPTIQPALSKRIWTFPGNIWHWIYYIIGSRVCISSRWQTQPKYLL